MTAAQRLLVTRSAVQSVPFLFFCSVAGAQTGIVIARTAAV
jgi:hypothetical protein